MAGNSEMNKKDLINVLYRSTLLSGVTIAYAYGLKRILKTNISSPSSANLEEVLKLGGVVTVSNMTLDYLFEQGIIPQNIVK